MKSPKPHKGTYQQTYQQYRGVKGFVIPLEITSSKTGGKHIHMLLTCCGSINFMLINSPVTGFRQDPASIIINIFETLVKYRLRREKKICG